MEKYKSHKLDELLAAGGKVIGRAGISGRAIVRLGNALFEQGIDTETCYPSDEDAVRRLVYEGQHATWGDMYSTPAEIELRAAARAWLAKEPGSIRRLKAAIRALDT